MVTVIIEKEAAVITVTVFDAAGKKYNLTAQFRQITGTTTPSAFENQLQLQDDGAFFNFVFTAIAKRLVYTLEPSVIKQLVAMAKGG